MKLTRRHRLLAMLGAGALIAAACGNDDDAETAPAEGDDEAAEQTDEGGGEGFVLGHLFPETGDLSFMGPPIRTGVEFANEDINAAGGVLGEDLTVLFGDEAGDAAQAREETQRLLGEGAQAIVGAAASGMSQEIIQTLSDNETVQCSPSNTSPSFSTQENADFYFRMSPSDVGQARIIAAEVAARGAETVAIAGRADDYGNNLANLVNEAMADEGVEVTELLSYDPAADTFDAEVGQLTADNPDAIVLISFDEAAQIIDGLLEAGVTPDQLVGADGVQNPDMPMLVDPETPGVIDGMIATAPAGDPESEDFNSRLREVVDATVFGAHAYDCTVVIALAVEAAQSTDSSVFIDEMSNVTQEGTECNSFEECRDLLADGEDINYQGVSGPVDLDEAGDPIQGRYAIAEFQADGAMEVVAEEPFDFSELDS